MIALIYTYLMTSKRFLIGVIDGRSVIDGPEVMLVEESFLQMCKALTAMSSELFTIRISMHS